MKGSHALPMGMALEGGESGELDAGGGSQGVEMPGGGGGGGVRRLFRIHDFAHRSL